MKRLERRASIHQSISHGMKALDKATKKYDLDEYYGKALSLVMSECIASTVTGRHWISSSW